VALATAPIGSIVTTIWERIKFRVTSLEGVTAKMAAHADQFVASIRQSMPWATAKRKAAVEAPSATIVSPPDSPIQAKKKATPDGITAKLKQ
jgi:hypothetical protein